MNIICILSLLWHIIYLFEPTVDALLLSLYKRSQVNDSIKLIPLAP